MKYVKYSKDRNSLERIVRDDTAYKSISRRTADMLNIITGSDLKYREGEEKIDMCKAIEDMRKESLEKGRAEGMEKGRAEGMIMTLISLVKDGVLPITEAAKRAGMTVDELKTEQSCWQQYKIIRQAYCNSGCLCDERGQGSSISFN